jgi:crooked neck
LLEHWKTFLEVNGTSDDVQCVKDMMPIKGKKRTYDEQTDQFVEGLYLRLFYSPKFELLLCISDNEYIFLDDERESNPTSSKFLQMAHAWKNSQTGHEEDVVELSGMEE